MKISNVKYYCTTNGEGFRTAVFVSGCSIHCPGCFNKKAWDYSFGFDVTPELVGKIMNSVDHEYIDGLSVLGGEPMDPRNQEGVLGLLREFRKRFGESKTVWMWSGYYRDKIPRTEFTDEILSKVDWLVDGPFDATKYDIDLRFRGSSNQHVINLREERGKKA